MRERKESYIRESEYNSVKRNEQRKKYRITLSRLMGYSVFPFLHFNGLQEIFVAFLFLSCTISMSYSLRYRYRVSQFLYKFYEAGSSK